MQVGYLGVGNMGQPMAGKLLDGGHSLVVFDVSEAAMEPLLLRQARRAASPRDLGDQCEIVAVSLPHARRLSNGGTGPGGSFGWPDDQGAAEYLHRRRAILEGGRGRLGTKWHHHRRLPDFRRTGRRSRRNAICDGVGATRLPSNRYGR